MRRDLTVFINEIKATPQKAHHLVIKMGVLHPEFVEFLRNLKPVQTVCDVGLRFEVSPVYLAQVVAAARMLFVAAYLIQGPRSIHLGTGTITQQLTLFDKAV